MYSFSGGLGYRDDDNDSVFGGMGGKSLKDLSTLADGDGRDDSVYSDDESVDGEGNMDDKSKTVSIFVMHPSNKFRQAWDMCQVGILPQEPDCSISDFRGAFGEARKQNIRGVLKADICTVNTCH